MRIIIFTSSYPLSDEDTAPAGNFIPPFARHLRKLGHDVLVLTQERPGAAKGEVGECPVRRFGWSGGAVPLAGMNLLNPRHLVALASFFISGYRSLKKEASRMDAHIILSLWAVPAGAISYLLKETDDFEYVVWSLGSDVYRFYRNPIMRPVLKRVFGTAGAVFADGLDLCRKVEELSGRECLFLPTLRNFAGIRSADIPVDSNKIHFVFVGRLEKVKGIDILLKAWKHAVRARRDIMLHIAGSGSMDGWVRRYVAENALAESVVLHGNMSAEELKGLMLKCHCFVLPSRSESIPVTFSEAVYCGLPFVVTDVGDMGGLVQEYGVGWVVPPADTVALEKAIIGFDAGFKKEVASRLEQLKGLFNIDAAVKRFIDTVSPLVKERHGGV